MPRVVPVHYVEMISEHKLAGGGKLKNTLFKTSDWSWKIIKDSLTLQPTNSRKIELVRSLIVSGVSFVGDAFILIFAKEILGIHYLVAAALGFLCGVVINYVLSVTWVFTTRKLASKHIEFTVFVVICTVGLGLNLLVIAALVERFLLDYRLAKVVATVLIFFWNFFMRKKLLY